MTDDGSVAFPPIPPIPPAIVPAEPDTFGRLAHRIGRVFPGQAQGTRTVLGQIDAVDVAVYRAVAQTPTPALDVYLQHLSDLANFSKIWVLSAGVLALVGGRRGRRAAVDGLASVVLASVVANQIVKPIAVRGRPDREGWAVPNGRFVRMPTSQSFPSGHTASAFAFATGVSGQIPALALPFSLLAAAVGYSRVHTGVHFPGDVLIGSVLGGASGEVAGTVLRVSRRGLRQRRGLRAGSNRSS